ncbi:14339_t:CDS:2, partial [Racocetra persica]
NLTGWNLLSTTEQNNFIIRINTDIPGNFDKIIDDAKNAIAGKSENYLNAIYRTAARRRISKKLNEEGLTFTDMDLKTHFKKFNGKAAIEAERDRLLKLIEDAELVKKIIRPNLQENKIVIIDRYLDSTFVYQGLEGNISIDDIQKIAQKTVSLPLPDLTFILDIEPSKAQQRLNKRRTETGEIHIIDASKNEDEVVEEVCEIIKQVHRPADNLPEFARVIIHNEKGEILLVKDKK